MKARSLTSVLLSINIQRKYSCIPPCLKYFLMYIAKMHRLRIRGAQSPLGQLQGCRPSRKFLFAGTLLLPFPSPLPPLPPSFSFPIPPFLPHPTPPSRQPTRHTFTQRTRPTSLPKINRSNAMTSRLRSLVCCLKLCPRNDAIYIVTKKSENLVRSDITFCTKIVNYDGILDYDACILHFRASKFCVTI